MVSATVTASLSDIDHDGRWSTYDENVRKLSRVPSTIKHKHMLFPPACSSPLITKDLPACPAAGVYFQ